MQYYSVWRLTNTDSSPYEKSYGYRTNINRAHQLIEQFHQEDRITEKSLNTINKSVYEVREVK